MNSDAAPARQRLFVALPIGENTRAALARAQDHLRQAGARVGWVPPGNIHLTFFFCGDVDAIRVPAIEAALQGALRDACGGAYRVRGLGYFGSARSPRVLWAGIDDSDGHLARLRQCVQGALTAEGFPGETRPFAPHLTLGRVRAPHGMPDVLRRMERRGAALDCAEYAQRVELMRSVLGPKGPVYELCAGFPLSTGS